MPRVRKVISSALRRLGCESILFWLMPFSKAKIVFNSENLKDYFSFRKKYAALLKQNHMASSLDRKILIVNLHSVTTSVKLEAMFAKILKIRGFSAEILTYRSNFWPILFFRLFGINKFVYFDDYLFRVAKKSLSETLIERIATFQTTEDVLGFVYQGVEVGKYALATLAREHRLARIDPKNKDQARLLKEYLLKSILNVDAAIEMLKAAKPTTILFLEKVYMPYGEIYSVAFDLGVDVLQWSGCHRESAVMLKRYTKDTKDADRSSISAQSWEHLKEMPFGQQHIAELEKEMAETYGTGQWFSEAGTQSLTRVMSKDDVQSKLKLDPKKKTAIVFAHMFWDAVMFDGKDLFDDFEEWFIEAVRVACRNTQVNWVIKLHPANRVKAFRDGYRGEYSELISLKKNIPSLPGHIKIIEPGTEISTYSLFSVMDYCLTVRGTIGIEASSFGIPVLMAGKGRYGGLGFTVDFKTRDAYIQSVENIHEVPALTPAQRELAQRYAYGQFMMRPLRLETIQFSYAKDAVSTPHMGIGADSVQELLKAPDVERFCRWVMSTDQLDYLA